MSPSLYKPGHAWRSSCKDSLVVVEVCDRRKQQCKFVDYIPLHVLEHYAPDALDLIEADALDNTLHLPLRLPSYKHVVDIEILGLTLMFSHWTYAPHKLDRPVTPPYANISEGVLLYRALQVLQVSETETLRSHIMTQLHQVDVTESGVQHIWWAFCDSPDWLSWLDALMHNIVVFQVLKSQPSGGAIDLFIETELFQFNDAQISQVISAYEFQKYILNVSLPSHFRRAVRHVL